MPVVARSPGRQVASGCQWSPVGRHSKKPRSYARSLATVGRVCKLINKLEVILAGPGTFYTVLIFMFYRLSFVLI